MRYWSCFRMCLLAGLILFIPTGCVTGPSLQVPENLPPIVRSIHHFKLNAGTAGLRDTGVYLDDGDLFSILACGNMDYCPRGNCGYHHVTPLLGWPLIARVGEKTSRYFHPYVGRGIGGVMRSRSAGNLYVGYKSGDLDSDGSPVNRSFYSDDTGAFRLEIILWDDEDYEQIADFYATLDTKNPENKVVANARKLAEMMREMQRASARATKAVEETKNEINALKKESAPLFSGIQAEVTAPAEPHMADKAKAEKIAQLEKRLEGLLAELERLDEMKKQFEDEKKKSAELARQLEEQERKEQELMVRLKEGAKAPPVIVIASPEDGSTVEVNFIQVNGVAEDDQGIRRIEIYINGKSHRGEDKRGITIRGDDKNSRLDFQERIPLREGENTIKVVATDADGLFAEKLFRVQCVERRKNIWAVVVGIDKYPNTRQLRYAVSDARAFFDHLVNFNRIPPENVLLLLNEDATLTKLRSALGTHLKKSAGPEDMVIIFFAGHGATEKDSMSPDGDGLEKYLLPCDADPRDLYATALPMGEITRIFNRIQAERLVFIADACYSGASGGRSIGAGSLRANISDAFLDRIAAGKGRVILSASGANEVSEENHQLRHGIFTYYLLQGLRGDADVDQDGVITVDEAFAYVSLEVPRATGQEQHPVKKGTVEGRLILSVLAE